MNNSKPSNEFLRLKAAFGHSVEGIKAIYPHPAFKVELWICALAIPAALLLAHTGVERALLIGSLLLVLMVELLNTGIETAIDRISTDIHPLSKLAKDVGSAAVLFSLINAGAVWFFVLLT